VVERKVKQVDLLYFQSGVDCFIVKQIHDNHIVIGLRNGIDNLLFCNIFRIYILRCLGIRNLEFLSWSRYTLSQV